MLIHIWFLVMMQAFMPAADRIASDFEARLHAAGDTHQLIGAAGHVARYTPLAARAL
jgi:hypothetical protein